MREGGAPLGQALQLRARQRDPVRHDCALSQQARPLIQLSIPATDLQGAPAMAAGRSNSTGGCTCKVHRHLTL